MNTGLLESYRWQAYVKTCAKRGDLKVVFERGDKVQPRTNKDTLFLPLPTQMTTDIERIKLLFYANHESSHHEYSTDFNVLEERPELTPGKTFGGDVWNAFEDNRVNHYANTDWQGVKENSADFYEVFLPELLGMHEKFINDPLFPKQFRDRRSSLVYLNLLNESHDVPIIRPFLKKFRALLSPEALDYVEKYKAGNYMERVLNAKKGEDGSRDLADLAIEVLNDVYGGEESDPPSESNEPESDGDESAQGDNDEDDNKEDGQTKENSEDGGNDDQSSEQSSGGDSASDEESKSNESGNGGDEKQSESMGGNGSEGNDEGGAGDSKEESGNGTMGGDTQSVPQRPQSDESLREAFAKKYPNADMQQGEHDPKGGTAPPVSASPWNSIRDTSAEPFVPAPYNEIQVIDYENSRATNCNLGQALEPGWPIYRNEWKALVDEIKEQNDGRGLSNTIRKLLQINTRARWSYGQKKGKLDSKNLHRLTLSDSGSYSERVFKQKKDAVDLDVAVQLVIDMSGSMAGQKIATAIVSANLLCDTISRSLRVPVEIVGFTHKDITRMAIFKSFDRKASPQELEERMLNAIEMFSYNADGEALNWAFQRIRTRKEKRKLMIVLSDGKPLLDRMRRRGGNIQAYTKNIVEEIEQNSPVDIVAIGIKDDFVSRYYKQNVVITETNQLEDALLTILKNKVMNGVMK